MRWIVLLACLLAHSAAASSRLEEVVQRQSSCFAPEVSQRHKQATVMLYGRRDDGARVLGTAVVVKTPHGTRLLTAYHVPAEFRQILQQDQMEVYASNGDFLGRATMTARAQQAQALMGQDIRVLASDVAILRMQDSTPAYRAIEGVDLAPQLSSHVYIGTPDVPIEEGASGGGVFNAQGQLMGVISAGFGDIDTYTMPPDLRLLDVIFTRAVGQTVQAASSPWSGLRKMVVAGLGDPTLLQALGVRAHAAPLASFVQALSYGQGYCRQYQAQIEPLNGLRADHSSARPLEEMAVPVQGSYWRDTPQGRLHYGQHGALMAIETPQGFTKILTDLGQPSIVDQYSALMMP